MRATQIKRTKREARAFSVSKWKAVKVKHSPDPSSGRNEAAVEVKQD